MWGGLDRKILTTILIVVIAFVLYCFNLYYFTPHTIGFYDAIPAKYVALSLVRQHNLDLDEYAESLTSRFPSDLHEEYGITVPYFLVAGKGVSGVHVLSSYGFGVALILVPFFYIVDQARPLRPGDFEELLLIGKVAMSILAALATGLLYLTLTEFDISEMKKIILCGSFGFGTNMWYTASNDTWQHGPAVFFILLSLYLLIKSRKDGKWYEYSAIPAGLAVWMRPAVLPFCGALLVYGIVKRRKELPGFILWGALPAALMLVYNYYYFGSLCALGQASTLKLQALLRTGSPHIWQTPYLEGLIGSLFSPSRGLFISSPLLLFALLNFYHSAGKVSKDILVFSLGAFFLLSLMPSKVFEWWGGNSFGNRYLLETLPLFMLSLSNQIDRIFQSRLLLVLFISAVAASVFIQYIGVFHCDGSWFYTHNLDQNPQQLWDLNDSEILYYIRKCFSR